MPRTINLALNRYAFHWSYPELLADEFGLFGRQGISIEWHDITPRGRVDKGAMYTGLLEEGVTDVYHAGEWACIKRVLSSPESWIVAKSVPGRGTLNSSFSLYVQRESRVRRPGDLAGRPVSIEAGTGSQYTTMLDLEQFIPRESINLVLQGEPHKRLLALLRGEAEAASLVGPWADIGAALGLRRVLRTKRSNPTCIVVRRDMDGELLRRFFSATNRAIARIDASPDRFRSSYFRHVREVLREFPLSFRRLERELRRRVKVSKWSPWRRYTITDFDETYRWMTERELAPAGRNASESVASYPLDLFSES